MKKNHRSLTISSTCALLVLPMLALISLGSCGNSQGGSIDYDNSSWNASNPDDFLFYHYEGQGYFVGDYHGQEKEVRIPSRVNIDGVEDDVVGLSAYCFSFREGIETLYLPNSITSIRAGAFSKSSIKNVYPGLGLREVNPYAFSDSNVIVTIKNGVTYLPSPSTPCYFAIEIDENKESISLEEGCIGYVDYLFDHYYNQIRFPSSLQIIGDIGELSELNIVTPSSLSLYRAPGAGLLFSCENLKTITLIGDGSEYGHSLFSQSTEKVILGKNLKTFDPSWTLSNYALSSIEVNGNNPNFKSMDGALYSKNGDTLVYYPSHKQDQRSFVIPKGVTSIAPLAFYNNFGIESLSLPEGVKSLGDGAFMGAHFSIFSLPETLIEIGERAFDGITRGGKKENGVIYFGSEENPHFAAVGYEDYDYLLDIHNDTKIIPDYAFSSCQNLGSLSLSNNLIFLGEGAFSNSSLTSISIGRGIAKIQEHAFSNCDQLTSLALSEKCEEFAPSAIDGCSSLRSLSINENNAHYVYDEGLYTIDKKTFVRCLPSYLGSFSTASSVEKIEKGAFSTCVELSGVSLNEGISILPDALFAGLTSLRSFEMPSTIKNIGNSLFLDDTSLLTVTVSKSLTNLPRDTFKGCSALSSINVQNGSLKYASQGGCLYTYDYKTLLRAPLHPNRISFHESCVNIGEYAFEEVNVSSITLSNSIKEIGYGAFYESKLTSFTASSSLESIGGLAFYLCRNMTSLDLANVSAIGSYAFQCCHGLTNVTLPEGLTKLENGTFYRCASLYSVIIPASLKSIGIQAFYWDDALKHINYLGDAASWDAIEIQEGNESLLSASIHCR